MTAQRDPYAAARAMVQALEDAAARGRATIDGHPEFLARPDMQDALMGVAELALVAAEALESLMTWVLEDPRTPPGLRSLLEAGGWTEITYDPTAPDADALGFVHRPTSPGDEAGR